MPKTIAPVAAAGLTAALLVPVQVMLRPPMLLAERFLPGAGWVEIALLAGWAYFVAYMMRDPVRSATWRLRIWMLFSIVFFGQFAIGLFWIKDFLMTGKLHFPIPALILAGPVYRGEGIIMPVILGASLLIAGPAWCSHLCYVGAWDNAAALLRKKPSSGFRGSLAIPFSVLLLTCGAATAMRLSGVDHLMADRAAAFLGVISLVVMVQSTRIGAAAHCSAFCPIGLVSKTVGRVNPFRIRITEACTGCGACSTACRFGALNPEDINARRPNFSCNLCGDCVGACRQGAIGYRFLRQSPETARSIFIAIVASLHSVFLGVARM